MAVTRQEGATVEALGDDAHQGVVLAQARAGLARNAGRLRLAVNRHERVGGSVLAGLPDGSP
ncbi:MAG: hypothetical protein BMS9Abin01_0128 [Gammaproteobacteria bacterium]|nr:MAG: hypothetical protein BMS9Abin01_0128 [Gammaproteobacteria bacterium]